MTKQSNKTGSGKYSSPVCAPLEVLTGWAILSASAVMHSDAEGYDVDEEVFNW